MKNLSKETKNLILGLLLIFDYLVIIPLLVSDIFLIFKIPLNTPDNSIIANLLIYIITIGLLLYIYRKTIKKECISYFKNFFKNFKTSFTYWLKALFFMMISNVSIIMILGNIAENESANRSIITSFPIFSIIAMVLLGPFIEELLFRKGFKKAFKNKTAFCLFTAFLFGAGHILISIDFTSLELFIENLPQLLFIIPYGGIGYILAESYWETNNIFTSTTAHVIHNLFSVIVSMIGV